MTNEQLAELKRLININSFTKNKAGVDRVAKEIMEICTDLPLTWEITDSDSKGNLYLARSEDWDESKPVVLLNGHLDTVFKENWLYHEEGERFFGPGTLDMKAGILIMTEVLKQLEEEDKLENVMMLLTPDEEDGMFHIEKQIEYYSEADYALVFEEGSWDHLDPKPEERAIVVNRKAVGFYEVEFEGVAGHNAKLFTQDERHSAILEMANVITNLERVADYEKGTLVNTGIVSSDNSAANIIADNAFIKVDIRYGNKEEVQRVETELQKIFAGSQTRDVKINAEQVLFYPSFDETEAIHEFADIVIEQGKKLDLNIRKQKRSSGSEANWIAYGNPNCAILDGFGVIGAGDHSEREFFYKDSFQQSIDLAVNTIKSIQ